MAKQYKPGQFVWVDGQKCRVTRKAKSAFFACNTCKRPNPCKVRICTTQLPWDCYPKPVNYE